MILFLAANPSGTPPLALDREARAIATELSTSGKREHFEFKTRWAMTPLDLLRELRRINPTVVHISAHGDGGLDEPADIAAHDAPTGAALASPRDSVSASRVTDHGLIFEGDEDESQSVSAAALTQLFAVIGARVQLVVLSASNTAPIAAAMCKRVDCVVGINGSISNAASRAFSVGFYGALGDGASVAAACKQGDAAIALSAGMLPQSAQPVLHVRTGVDADALRLANLDPSTDFVRAMYLRLTVHLFGVEGFGLALATLIVGVLGLRTWFAVGESDLALRVQQLTVQATDAPQPVQDNATVRELTAQATILAGLPPGLPTGEHKIALRGAFAQIDFAGRSASDPGCRLHLVAEPGHVAIDRATQIGTPCDHQVFVSADAAGLALMVDDGSPAAIAPGVPLLLRLAEGKAVRLSAGGDRLSLFRPANNIVWPATGVEARAAPGERVRLPGGLWWRSSDTVELTGAIELRELAFDRDRLFVSGALRSWRGSVGRKEDWDASAPWPSTRALLCLLMALTLAALAVLWRMRARWREFKRAPV